MARETQMWATYLEVVGATHVPVEVMPRPSPSTSGSGRDGNHAPAQAGRRRIAHIAGAPDSMDAGLGSEARTQCLRRTRLRLVDQKFGDWSGENEHAAAPRLLPGTLRFNALFCASDQMTLGALSALALATAGMEVPGAVAVIGFADISASRFFQPALAAIRQDSRKVGRRLFIAASGVGEGGDHLATGMVARP